MIVKECVRIVTKSVRIIGRNGARSAVVLTLLFAGLALWMGIGRRDPVAVLFAVLAICCAGAGYGTILAIRRPSAP